MNIVSNTILFLLLFDTSGLSAINHCDRTPEKVLRPKNTAEVDKYVIELSGDPTSYIPGDTYTVTLTYNPILDGAHMFREFMLSVEKVNLANQSKNSKVGDFILTNDQLTTFSTRCENTIFQTSSIQKTSAQVYWVAPPSGSGCVAFRATVVESKENWYSDDGSLTKILCEEESENEDIQPAILDECTACDEAKYELVFEGLWSRNTHPKDYPSNIWYTKFGDIVGASHAKDESFWNYGELASEELKSLGEKGDTSGVEKQLKERMGKTVRTIIKANGLRYPNITGKTFTFFRVDKKNHLASVVTKITPSPDWILGVSSFELCMGDGTWAERRIMNLYPWDIGTDYAVSYNSVSEPLAIPTVIQAMKTDDEKSPFYDSEAKAMKPFAKLYFTRLKTYKKECEETEVATETNTEDGDEICAAGNWSDWSTCTKTCGEGTIFRRKELLNPENIELCADKLEEHRPCNLRRCKSPQDDILPANDPRCKLSEWSAWSSCSVSCGNGTSTRDKKFLNPEYTAQCENNDPAITQQNARCKEGEEGQCTEEETKDCADTVWGPWTPCSVTCGSGNKTRLRMSGDDGENDESESECRNMEQVTCFEPLCEQGEGATESVFGVITVLNQLSTEKIYSAPTGPVANCKVSKYSIWGPCELNNGTCGRGYRFRHRQILQHAINGGKACPRKLMKKKSCFVPCEIKKVDVVTVASSTVASTETNMVETTEVTTEENVDCIMAGWSQWSPCSSSCGSTAVQQRTRSIKRPARKNGRPCGPRLQQRACPLPLACSDKGLPIM